MKRNAWTRTILAVLILAVGMLGIVSALAGTSTEKKGNTVSGTDELTKRLNELNPFKFEKHKEGIGYGECPVYTAPSADAYRCAGGKARVSTDAAMDDAGYEAGWLLVRYETSDGGCRVGYIPPRYVKGFESNMYPHFDYIPATADDIIYVSDNPMRHDDSFAMLEEGEEFFILSKYDYYRDEGFEWWYIECTVDGQVARGFIDCQLADFHLGTGR